MLNAVRDLRHSLRAFGKSPGFAAAAVLAFALGIGANTAIFSVVHSVLLRPLAYADPDRLVVAEHAGPSPVAPATYLDWKQQATTFEQMAAAQAWGGSLRADGRPEAVVGLRVSANLFSMLGVPAAVGRTFAEGEDQEGAVPVVVLSWPLWQRSFGGARDIVGRQVSIDGSQYTVAGVMPQTFQFAPFWVTKAEMWAPLLLGPRKTDRVGNSLRIFGRLKRGVTIEQAQAEMSTIMSRLAQQYPETNRKDTVSVVALRERVVGGVRAMLLILLGTVTFVLLIACANVANLLLARATSRRRELAVRLALGASRLQLARQAMTECALLAMAGGGIGVWLAWLGVHALDAVLPAGTLPRQQEVGLDGQILLFSAALSLATGVMAGLLPAWQWSRGDINEALKEASGRGGSEGRRSHRARNALVAAEVALAFVLLVGAGLMVRSLARLLSEAPGFDPRNLISLQVSVSGTRQADPSRRAQFYQGALERVRAVPGVASASLVNHAPITGDVWGTRFRIEGRPVPNAGEWPGAVYRVAYPGYFATMGAALVRGRDFDMRDNLQSPRVVIVNETLARKHWPAGNGVGQRIAQGNGSDWLTVAGVVSDMKQQDWQANPREEIYFPLLQSVEYLSASARHYEFVSFVVRVDHAPAAKVAGVRQAIESIDPNVLVSDVIPMEQAVAHNTWRPRLSLLLLGAFAAVALVLAVTGIYAVISHAMSQRTHEMGIRMAVGAGRRDVLTLSIAQGLRPVLVGMACGGVLALSLSRLMSTMLFGVTAEDPVTFAGVAFVMFGAGLAAILWPALRASRVDPLVALRHS